MTSKVVSYSQLRQKAISSLRKQQTNSRILKSTNGDVFYSRSDLYMMINRSRTKSRSILLEMHSLRKSSGILIPTENINATLLEEAIVASLDMDLLEIVLKDYSSESSPSPYSLFIQSVVNARRTYNDSPCLVEEDRHLAHPLHLACTFHLPSIPLLLQKDPTSIEAIRQTDFCGRFPLQIVLLRLVCAFATKNYEDSELFEWVKLLIKHHAPLLDKPFHPIHPCTDNEIKMLGFLPLHMACTQNKSISIIFEILRNHPAAVEQVPIDQ